MHRQTQRQGSCGSTSAYGGTDWQALEVQLTRTRTILQEILVHLQEVLKNLKSARTPGRSFGSTARPEAGRFGGQTRTGDARHSQATPPPHGTRTQRPQTGPAAGQGGASATAGATGSDRFRAKPRPGHETRTEAGPSRAAGSEAGQSRTTASQKTRTEETRTFRAGASARPGPTAGTGTRDRARTESTFRARPGAATGAERETRHGYAGSQNTSHAAGAAAGQTTVGASRVHARPASRPSGFRMDRDRQRRAREAARKSGMNLKCAYDILCLDYPCSVDEIKIAYRHMARLHHPDLGGDEEAMKDVNVAYELAMRFSAGPRRANTSWAV